MDSSATIISSTRWLVLGAEADIQAADIGSHGNAVVGIVDAIGPHLQSVNSTKKVDWFGTVRGRVGFTLPSMPNLMVYGTGGFAYGQVVHNVGFADNFLTQGISARRPRLLRQHQSRLDGGRRPRMVAFHVPGVVAQGRISLCRSRLDEREFRAAQRRLPALIGPTIPVFAATQSSPTRFHTVRAGLNWHFDPFAARRLRARAALFRPSRDRRRPSSTAISRFRCA